MYSFLLSPLFLNWKIKSFLVGCWIFCKRAFFLLAFVWFLGLESGRFYAAQSNNTYLLLMRVAAMTRPSIIGLAVSVLLPFLITIGSVYFARPSIIYILAFLWAELFGYSSACLQLMFGSAGWLIRLLLFFTDGWAILLLLWIWLRWIGGGARQAIREITFCGILCSVVWIIDYFVVSPFLGMLI